MRIQRLLPILYEKTLCSRILFPLVKEGASLVTSSGDRGRLLVTCSRPALY